MATLLDKYYYRSDGIQISGTAQRYGGNAYIYGFDTVHNIIGQIFPREVTRNFTNADFGGGFNLATYKSNGESRDCAYQGAKSIGKSRTEYYDCWGHIFPRSMPSLNSARVNSVTIGFQAHHCGIHNINRTLRFHCASNNSWETTDVTSSFDYVMDAGTDSVYHTISSDTPEGAGLVNMMNDFINRRTHLFLYNWETYLNFDFNYSDGTGWGSTNYAAIESFDIISMSITYIP